MKVLYIAGAGRSGSTLIEMILGNVPGCFSVGEIRHYWEYLLQEDIRCGCGEHLGECAFWSRIRHQLSRIPGLDLQRTAELSLKLDRTHNLTKYNPSLAAQPDFRELVSANQRLYSLVKQESQAEWIVDSSKAPSHLYILNQIEGIELSVLHLIRDPRAVAYSWNRRVKQEPGRSSGGKFMEQRPVIPTALRWAVENYYASKFGKKSGNYTVLRYEDFVADPQEKLQITLSKLDIRDIDLEQVFFRGKILKPTHSVGGNPIRFNTQEIKVSSEETWKKDMNLTQRLAIGLVSLPLIIKHGYRLV